MRPRRQKIRRLSRPLPAPTKPVCRAPPRLRPWIPIRPCPLVLYLHGAGGLGDDNRKQYTGGYLFGSHVWALEENQATRPAFILAPQTDQGWGYRGALRSGEPGPEAIRTRIYVTGQSMGGAGSRYLAMRRPDLFAAAVPVCGGGNTAKAAALPGWLFAQHK